MSVANECIRHNLSKTWVITTECGAREIDMFLYSCRLDTVHANDVECWAHNQYRITIDVGEPLVEQTVIADMCKQP